MGRKRKTQDVALFDTVKRTFGIPRYLDDDIYLDTMEDECSMTDVVIPILETHYYGEPTKNIFAKELKKRIK